MYIAGFHIDGFGLFANVGCQNIGPGLSVFYGQNEAGKSTCLEFFRTMLVGYPERGGTRGRAYEPLNGGRPGGSILIHCEQEPYELRVSRAPAAFGGLRLAAPNGASLHGDVLARVMGHISRDAYSKIFGFSLEELERWDKKSEESVRSLLYGASFGPGLLPPGEAIKKLDKLKGDLFKPRGMSTKMIAALRQLEEIKSDIRKLQEEFSLYDDLSGQLSATEKRLEDLRLKRVELETERRDLERRLDQWRNWEQWRQLGARLAKLEEIGPDFPEEAIGRLGIYQSESANEQANLARESKKLEQIAARASEIEIDGQLLADLPEIKRLSERKSGYRRAIEHVDAQVESLREAKELLKQELAHLGPDWSCERIRDTDRSLFAREGMEKLAASLSEASLARQTASASLAKANHELEKARAAIKDREAELAALPEPQAILDEEERERLRANMRALEDSRRNAPGLERALKSAERELNRALDQAQVFSAEKDESEIAQTLDRLVEHQEEAIALAGQMQNCLAAASEAASQVAACEREEEAVKQQIETIRDERLAAGGATRAALEAQTAALRQLRTLAGNIENEEELKKELERRLAEEPPQIRNWALVIFGLLFLAGSAAILAAHWLWGMTELAIAPGAVIPLNLWAAYAALLCGVVLFGAGYSAHGPQYKRHKEEHARLLSRSEACSMHLAEMGMQARQLCQAADVKSADPIELDATELKLEREKMRLFEEERSRKEIDACSARLRAIQARLAELKEQARQKETSVQQCRRRWHGLMQSLRIENVPSPESVATIFARVDYARMAEQNAKNARAALDELWENFHVIEQSITDMPAIKDRLESAPEPTSMEAAVQQALESCKDADRAREKRLRLQAELESASRDLYKAEEQRQEASGQLEATSAAYETATADWAACVAGLGLPEGMNPETVRQAYKYMRDCLNAEDRVAKLARELEQTRAEIRTMENPLGKLLARYGKETQLNLEGRPDWLITLDNLLAEAERNSALSDRLEIIRADLGSQREEVEARENALAAAREIERKFIESGGVSSADEFIRRAKIRDERRSLRSQQEALELALEQAAQGEDTQKFLASFNGANREEEEKRLRDIQTGLDLIAEEDRSLAKEAGRLQASVTSMEESDELPKLRQREARLQAEISQMAREWSKYALAGELLKEARKTFEKERQPEIVRQASAIFANITGGRWAGMSINLEDSSLMMLPHDGEPVAPGNLSRGAQEQAYLALRLAYVKLRAQAAEPLPLIMDEVLVNFDPERAKRTAAAFGSLAEGGRQQILYFTCQPHIVDMLKAEVPEAGLYKVENGEIMAA